MKAWSLKDIADIELIDYKMRDCNRDEVLIRVGACGVCGSDIPRIFKEGAHNMPIIPGHEFAGMVENVGPNVDSSWIGKRVGVFPLIPCKKCVCCSSGHFEMCSNYSYIGSRQDGAFAEYVIVPLWNIIELTAEVTLEQAAMLEPLAVANHAINQVDISYNDSIVVIGMGTIGQLVAMLLHAKGYSDISVIGNKNIQHRACIEWGLNDKHFCDIRLFDIHDYVMEKTSGRGANVVFECIGTNSSINNAIDILAPLGKVVLVGNPSGDISFDKNIYWKILRKQLTLCGTWNSSYGTEGIEKLIDDWREALNMISSGDIHPEYLITHRLGIENINTGFELMKEKHDEYIKVMMVNEEKGN